MSEDVQTEFPELDSPKAGRPAARPAVSGNGPVRLEGMKVLFDDKVGLFPVTLVAKKPRKEPGA